MFIFRCENEGFVVFGLHFLCGVPRGLALFFCTCMLRFRCETAVYDDDYYCLACASKYLTIAQT